MNWPWPLAKNKQDFKMNGASGVPSALATSMGREKKPFTYLPGGIDFSELKSPKMQKRINKHLQGSGQSPDQTVGVCSMSIMFEGLLLSCLTNGGTNVLSLLAINNFLSMPD